MEEMLSPRQVSERFGIAIPTLAKWRWQKVNLPYVKPGGKKVLYRRGDLEKFFESRSVEVKG